VRAEQLGPRPLTGRFDEALKVASDLHRHQARKGGDIPYISHLLAVCATVLEHGGDEDEAIAALLHDGPEDQGGQVTLDMIGERFGPRVVAIVAECSDTFEHPKPPWRGRKEAYLAHLKTEASPSAFLVAAADKLHNLTTTVADLRATGELLWARFNSTADQQVWHNRSWRVSIAIDWVDRSPPRSTSRFVISGPRSSAPLPPAPCPRTELRSEPVMTA
jgi:(p)ppGpp synthase/HD superfamily hydrolase